MIQQSPFFTRESSSARDWWEWSQRTSPTRAADSESLLSAAGDEPTKDGVDNTTAAAAAAASGSDDGGIENEKIDWNAVAQGVLAVHVLLWIAVVALVATLFATHTPQPLITYALAPYELSTLTVDIVPVYARIARGFFAESVNVAIACLVAQTSLALLVPERRIGGITVAVVAMLVLFMQEKWHLTFGGLLWSELVLAVTFFAVGSRMRGVALPLSLPVLAVAALANAGETDSGGLTTVYFSLCGMPLLWNLVFAAEPQSSLSAPDEAKTNNHRSKTDEEGEEENELMTKNESWVLGAMAWLSVVPLYARGGLILSAGVQDAQPSAYAALVFVLVWVGLLLLGMGAWTQLPSGTQSSLYVLHQIAHVALLMLILIGQFKN